MSAIWRCISMILIGGIVTTANIGCAPHKFSLDRTKRVMNVDMEESLTPDELRFKRATLQPDASREE